MLRNPNPSDSGENGAAGLMAWSRESMTAAGES